MNPFKFFKNSFSHFFNTNKKKISANNRNRVKQQLYVVFLTPLIIMFIIMAWILINTFNTVETNDIDNRINRIEQYAMPLYQEEVQRETKYIQALIELLEYDINLKIPFTANNRDRLRAYTQDL